MEQQYFPGHGRINFRGRNKFRVTKVKSERRYYGFATRVVMITFKSTKRKAQAIAATAFAGVLLVNGMNASAEENIKVDDAPAAIAGSVYEQAKVVEEAKAAAQDAVAWETASSADIIMVDGGSEAGSSELIQVDAEGSEDTSEEQQAGTDEEKEDLIEGHIEAVEETDDEDAEVYAVPAYSGKKSYESYKVIRRGKAGTLQQMASTDEDGFRTVDGRYMIAVGTYFGASRGQYLDLTLSNGTVIPCVVGDMKAASIFSANGCCSEFIVDTGMIKNVVNSGDVSDYRSEWDSPVNTITVYDEYAL